MPALMIICSVIGWHKPPWAQTGLIVPSGRSCCFRRQYFAVRVQITVHDRRINFELCHRKFLSLNDLMCLFMLCHGTWAVSKAPRPACLVRLYPISCIMARVYRPACHILISWCEWLIVFFLAVDVFQSTLLTPADLNLPLCVLGVLVSDFNYYTKQW